MRRVLAAALSIAVLLPQTAEAKKKNKDTKEAEAKKDDAGDKASGDAGSSTSDTKTGTSPMVWVGFGTAVVGGALGALFGADSIHATNTAKTYCVDNRCGPRAFEFMDQANTSAWISNVSFGVAIVGLGVGIWGLVAPPDLSSKPPAETPQEKPDYHPAPPGVSLNVRVGPGSIALMGAF